MRIEPAAALRGHIAVPGDKSISHRAVLLGAIGEGETSVRGFGRSGDTEATIAAVREASQSREIRESFTNEFAIADSAIQDEFLK